MTPIGFLQRDKDLEIYIYIYLWLIYSGRCFGTWILWLSICWAVGNNDLNWLVFFRGVETTNQYIYIYIARKHVFTIQLPSSNGNLKISSFFIYQSHCKWALLGPGKSHVGCEKDPASRRLDFNNVRMITMTILDCWFQTLVLYGVMMVNDG